ncbi:DUF3987 domain-containing protein [Erythrobacter sp. SCSIO 43205]|uniref:DUF3987 domain-containing protein n=1 Tax=Erythrobacter sp. SCSIO 43205 TaxID=2779361 RepID=UPI001CA7EFE4|nr:DUF3987 domain-containing protein [Erythrobacter sp. SCSIO 43205]UAB76981.1 DUF3987 domain-containing protein [Erythrobacter sp. SCSIO 43205]
MSKTPRYIEAEARAFVQMLAPAGGIHLVAIHPKSPIIYGKHFGYDVEAALEFIEKHNGDGLGVYWSVNCVRPQRHRKPSKEDISHARFAHVDIDPPKNGGKFDKPAIIEALSDLNTPPSFIIDSGGGLGAFWRLDDYCQNLGSIEVINRQIQSYFGADACWNIDRVMRVPGTVNYPSKKKSLAGRRDTQSLMASADDGTAYSPQELAAAFPATTTNTAHGRGDVAIPANVTPLTAADLGASEELRIAIEEPPGTDRSGDGVAAARLMAYAGHTDAQIMGVLLNHANAVSGHFLDQRDSKRAAARAIALVRADGPPSIEPDQAPMSAADHARLVENMRAKAKRDMALDLVTEKSRDYAEPPKTVPAHKEPEWLADLGENGLARFVRHVTANAPSPQPWLTLGAALAMFGTVAGRRYAGPTDLRTNLYTIGICDSGGGKDTPLRAITRLMVDAGLQAKVGGSKIASGSGLVTAVTRQPSILFPLDEVGFLIASAADRKRAPKHVTEIIDNLTEFYSMADSTFLGTAYANDKEKPREVIEQPCLSLFGVTTPGVFWGSLSSGNVLDGSLARMLIFQSENDYPDAQHDIMRSPMPDNLVELVKAIDAGARDHTALPMGDGPQQTPRPYVVPYADDEAKAYAKSIRDEQTSMLREYRGTNLTSIIARLAENAAKVALVRAIVENPQTPCLSVKHLQWGMMVSHKSVGALMQAVKERVADTEYESHVKRVHKAIVDAGAAGIDGTSLSRATQFVDRRKRADIIAQLVESAMIRIEERQKVNSGPGAAAKVYYDIS